MCVYSKPRPVSVPAARERVETVYGRRNDGTVENMCWERYDRSFFIFILIILHAGKTYTLQNRTNTNLELTTFAQNNSKTERQRGKIWLFFFFFDLEEI